VVLFNENGESVGEFSANDLGCFDTRGTHEQQSFGYVAMK
jgi:hypothetical protein